MAHNKKSTKQKQFCNIAQWAGEAVWSGEKIQNLLVSVRTKRPGLLDPSLPDLKEHMVAKLPSGSLSGF